MGKLFIFFFHLLLLHLHGNVAIIKSLYISLLNDRELRSLTNTKTYKSFGFFFKYSSELPPLKYKKNKICIKQVKALQFFFFCSILFFFFLFACLFLFCYCLVMILKYRKKKSAKDSYELIVYPRFSLFSQDGEVTSP